MIQEWKLASTLRLLSSQLASCLKFFLWRFIPLALQRYFRSSLQEHTYTQEEKILKLLATNIAARDYCHLFSNLELDSELPRWGSDFRKEGKEMSWGEREGAKDKLCLLHYFAKKLALADSTRTKHEWSQCKFHKETSFSTLYGSHVFICLSPLDCKPLQERNSGLNFSESPVTDI